MNLQVFVLETETGKLQRALRKEIGNSFDLRKVLDGSSNWRGRAQQILVLKERINEIEKNTDGRTVSLPYCRKEFANDTILQS